MIAFEEEMRQGGGNAVRKGCLHLDGRGQVHETLARIVLVLDRLSIPYAVIGAMAMYAHGFRRGTVDVDIIVTQEGRARLHEHAEQLGFVPAAEGSKHLRDVSTGVKVKLLPTGAFPGDNQPKPVAFFDPAVPGMTDSVGGVRYATRLKLVELMLASGIACPHRLKDLGAAQEFIENLGLPANLVERLDPSVREEYRKRWEIAHSPRADWEGIDDRPGIPPRAS